jgi:hypothetical protein
MRKLLGFVGALLAIALVIAASSAATAAAAGPGRVSITIDGTKVNVAEAVFTPPAS